MNQLTGRRLRRTAGLLAALLVASIVLFLRPPPAHAAPDIPYRPGTGANVKTAFTPDDPNGYKEAHFFVTPEREPGIDTGADGYFFSHSFPHVNPARANQNGSTVSAKATGTVSNSASPLTTTWSGTVVYAFVSTPAGGTVTVTDNRGLSWTRVNTAAPPVANVLVFRAPTDTLFPTSGLVVTASNTVTTAPVELTVRALGGLPANDGAQVVAQGASGGRPSVTVTPTTTGSQIVAVGFDPTAVRTTLTPGSNQTKDAHHTDSASHSTMWVQHHNAPTVAGTPVTISATLGSPVSNDAWVLFAFEILPKSESSYIGVQPGGRAAVWSHFGSEVTWTPASPTQRMSNGCNGGADGGPGVSCFLAPDAQASPQAGGWPFVAGHRYEIRAVISTSTAPGMQRETGSIRDVTTSGAWATIGAFDVPTYLGNFKLQDVYGFDEMFSWPVSCEEQNYVRVRRDPPTAVTSTGAAATARFTEVRTHQAYPGTPYVNDDCNRYAATFTTAKAANPSGPAISSHAPPRGAQLLGSTRASGLHSQTTPAADIIAGSGLGPIMLLAYVSTRANGAAQTATIQSSTSNGVGLQWSLVDRMDDPEGNGVGTGGSVEVWKAVPPANGKADNPTVGTYLQDLQVTSALVNDQGWTQTVTLQAWSNASAIGATAKARGKDGRPRVTLTPTRSKSTVASVGYDYSSQVDVRPTAPLLDERAVDDNDPNPKFTTMWVQHQDSYTKAATPTTVGADLYLNGAQSADWWNLLSVEITSPTPVQVGAPVEYESSAGPVATTYYPVRTALPDTLLVAVVSTHAGQTATVDNTSNGGTAALTWTRASRYESTAANVVVEVWTARATAPLTCFDGQPGAPASPCVRVRSTLTGGSPATRQTVFVTTLTNASGVGAVASNTGTGSASVALTPTASGSLVLGVGGDSTTRVYPLPPSVVTGLFCSTSACLDRVAWDQEGPSVPAGSPGRSMWAQHLRTPTLAGTAQTLSATLAAGDRWALTGVEVKPAP